MTTQPSNNRHHDESTISGESHEKPEKYIPASIINDFPESQGSSSSEPDNSDVTGGDLPQSPANDTESDPAGNEETDRTSSDAETPEPDTKSGDAHEGTTTHTARDENQGDSLDTNPSATSSESDTSDTESDMAGNGEVDDPAVCSVPAVTHAFATALHACASFASTVRATHAYAIARTAGHLFQKIWDKRLRFSYVLYILVFALVTAASVTMLQWSVYTEPDYADSDSISQATKLMQSVRGQVTKFISQMWMENNMVWLLNFLVLGLIYLVLLFLINRFWVATAIFGTAMAVFTIANHFKVLLRTESIIPSDLSFISSGNSGEILSFIPRDSIPIVIDIAKILVGFALACVAMQFIDKRNGFIPCHWRHPFRNAKTIAGNSVRILAFLLTSTLLATFTWNLGVPGSWAYMWAGKLNDAPMLVDTLTDARYNGPAISFLRLAHAKTMDKPDGYSKDTMLELANRYAKTADKINQKRSATLTDSTVIMILSESFSDPTRVPGIAFGEDPMPNIRALKETTTSGLMLSPGYGGGTANIEYQALTGLNLANFDDSMMYPYQQLVLHQESPFTFNQLWKDRYGDSGSIAFHPYYKNMYLRDVDYKKFGFDYLRTLDSDPEIAHHDRIDNSPYTGDASAYQNILDAIDPEHPQFIQMVTMQNHTPYNDWYANNQFKESDMSGLGETERYSIDTYAKGISLTDQSTMAFLNKLDTLNTPITVIFYGDHLPSIYMTAAGDPNNALALHETDYFIWSNQASASSGMKIDSKTTSYSSSNFFMATAAAHMDAKVTPYLSLLTKLSEEIPAEVRLSLQSSNAGNTSSTYVDASGAAIDHKSLSEKAKRLLEDYQLVQYDLTAGKGYLKTTDFLGIRQ